MITFDIDQEARLILCRARGGISVLDVANYLQALVRDPRFEPTFNAMIVVADTASIPPFAMLRFINPLISAWSAKRGNAKWAFVLPNEAARALVETELKHIALNQVQTRCFTAEPVAKEWLVGRAGTLPVEGG